MTWPFDAADLAAINRLANTYNGNAYNASTNPGGMAAGGHRTNFIPALDDVALIAQAVADAAEAAEAAAEAGEGYRDAAELAATSLRATSTTSIAIGIGSKGFTTQEDKYFAVGTWVIAKSDANPTANYMVGQVTAYTGTALTVLVATIGGSGTFADWTIEVSAKSGETGAPGATGSTGPSPAIQWNYSTGTTDSDPGNGLFKFDTLVSSAITFIYFDNTNKDTVTVTAWLDALDDSTNTTNRGRLYIFQPSDPTKFIIVNVTGAVTDGIGYRKVPVTYVASSAPSAVPFTAAAAIAFDFSPSGNKGVDGGGAGDTVGPSSATDGAVALFDGITGKLLKDSVVGIGTSGGNLGKLNTANTWSAAQSLAAKLDIQQDFALSGDISPAQVTGNQTDWAPTGISTASVIRFTTDQNRLFYSLSGGADGRVIAWLNVGAQYAEIVHDDGSTGTAAMRFSLPGSVNRFVAPGEGVAFIYDATSSRWRLLGAGSSPRFTSFQLGAESDTTFTRPAAARAQIENEEIFTTYDLSGVFTANQQRGLMKNLGLLLNGQCRLVESGGSILLTRLNGRFLFIDGKLETIPSSGPTLTTSGLSSSTLYYVYAWMNSGVMTLEASATAFADDTTYGHKIKTGDATRTLVGLIRTTAATAFADTAAQRFVLSWFNRRIRSLEGTATPTSTTTSTGGFVELSTGSRVEFITWADEAVTAICSGYFYNNTAGQYCFIDCGLDGTTAFGGQSVAGYSSSPSYSCGGSVSNTEAIAVGYHYLTPTAVVGGGTGTFHLKITGHVVG